MCAQIAEEARLRATLSALEDAASQAEFRVPSAESAARVERRDELIWSIREYLIPRLGDLEGPVVAVLIGSTGAGKSTLLNSIAQRKISEPGAVRPTTRRPTIWCHEHHAHRYDDSFLTGYSLHDQSDRSLQVVTGTDEILDGMTLIDAPDFDSVVEVHREIADELLAIADVCLFVTSAQRYADAVPWEFLEKAKSRDIPIVLIVNRMGRRGAREVLDDYRALLDAGGIHPTSEDIVTISEQSVNTSYAGVSKRSVRPVLKRLTRMAEVQERSDVLTKAILGGIVDVSRRSQHVAEDIENELVEVDQLRTLTESVYQDQVEELADALKNGTLIRGEVLKRWQAFVGTGELLRAMTSGASRIRSWARTVFGGTQAAQVIVGREATNELVDAVVRRADLAARLTATAWELHPAGASLLTGGDLWRRDDGTQERAELAVTDWVASLSLLVEEQGEGKKKVAKAASIGINAAAVSLLLVVFAHTGGLSGGEFGIAAGAAAAQQGLLEHVFGSAAAKTLADKARSSLETELEKVMATDAARFFEKLKPLPTGDGAELRRLAASVLESSKVWHGA